MSIRNKLKSLFSRKKTSKPQVNVWLTVDQRGNLIKWGANPIDMFEIKIVSGVNENKKFTFLENTYRL